MKKLGAMLAFMMILGFVYSCKTSSPNVKETKTTTDANGYAYEYVTNDASNTRIYTL